MILIINYKLIILTTNSNDLGFIHRESFHWYNRLQSSLFLEFFINRYSLPIIIFVHIRVLV